MHGRAQMAGRGGPALLLSGATLAVSLDHLHLALLTPYLLEQDDRAPFLEILGSNLDPAKITGRNIQLDAP